MIEFGRYGILQLQSEQHGPHIDFNGGVVSRVYKPQEESRLETCAYHESGHAVMAVLLGGKVQSVSIDPDWDEGPRREGEVQIHWPRSLGTPSIEWRSLQVSLAGPVAEMIFTGDPFHPAVVEQWSCDWDTAWTLAARLEADRSKRLRYLEHATRAIHQQLRADRVWQAIAALADELLAHELLECEEVHETVLRWL